MWLKIILFGILFGVATVVSQNKNCFGQQIPPATQSSSDDQAEAATAKKIAAYQKKLDESEWSWDDRKSETMYYLRRKGKALNLRLETQRFSRLKISLIQDGKSVYSWNGNFKTVFCVSKDRFYYIDHASVTGGKLVAVDLKSGKEVWRSQLKAIGSLIGTFSRARFNMSMVGDDVSITGSDFLGRYMEIKSGETGETLANRIYERNVRK